MAELTSNRLRLIPFEQADSKIFHSINTCPFVRKYLWDDEVISLELTSDILAKNDLHFSADKYGLWKIVLKENQEVAGYAGLWFFFDEGQPQLLYALKQQYTGSGFASEAAKLVIDYAFTKLGFGYLIASTDKPNVASQKVAERLGMEMIEEREVEGKITLFFSTQSATHIQPLSNHSQKNHYKVD